MYHPPHGLCSPSREPWCNSASPRRSSDLVGVRVARRGADEVVVLADELRHAGRPTVRVNPDDGYLVTGPQTHGSEEHEARRRLVVRVLAAPTQLEPELPMVAHQPIRHGRLGMIDHLVSWSLHQVTFGKCDHASHLQNKFLCLHRDSPCSINAKWLARQYKYLHNFKFVVNI